MNIEKNSEIVGIKNELVQVVLNIINNSKDAFKSRNIKDRKIIIKTSNDTNNLTVAIKDNAGGIDENVLEKIFEPYFTTKHQSQGTGIGLYMSREIIQDHLRGTINAHNIINKKKEKGMEFKIIIPLA